MLSTISWGDFITTLIVLLAVYYIAIGLLYFRKDISAIIGRFAKANRDSKENRVDTSSELKV